MQGDPFERPIVWHPSVSTVTFTNNSLSFYFACDTCDIEDEEF